MVPDALRLASYGSIRLQRARCVRPSAPPPHPSRSTRHAGLLCQGRLNFSWRDSSGLADHGGSHGTTLGVVVAVSAWLSGQCTRAESRAPALSSMRWVLVDVRRCRGVRCSTCATTCTPSPFVVSLSKWMSRLCPEELADRRRPSIQARGRMLSNVCRSVPLRRLSPRPCPLRS